ncbi:hypothetical protein RD792_017709, partial [Penstemon davidsonii]
VPYTKSDGSLPTPPAFAINNLLPTEINFPMQQHHHNHHSQVIEEEYPLRPGEPECSFFLKTGDCKFKSTCKFHHPKNRITKAKTKAKASSSALNDQGLPLRPVSDIIAFEMGLMPIYHPVICTMFNVKCYIQHNIGEGGGGG